MDSIIRTTVNNPLLLTTSTMDKKYDKEVEELYEHEKTLKSLNENRNTCIIGDLMNKSTKVEKKNLVQTTIPIL